LQFLAQGDHCEHPAHPALPGLLTCKWHG
jgi:hypothetical protein